MATVRNLSGGGIVDLKYDGPNRFLPFATLMSSAPLYPGEKVVASESGVWFEGQSVVAGAWAKMLPKSIDAATVGSGPPLAFTDARFGGMTETTSQLLIPDGQSRTKQSITMRGAGEPQGRSAVQMGNSTTLTFSRMFSREGVRHGGVGITLNTVWIEIDGFIDEDDHADGCQLFPAATGLIDCTNVTFRAHSGGDLGANSAGSVGYFWADNFQGTARFSNCVFWGGEFGCRIHADVGVTHLDFSNVYFVGPFTNSATLITPTGGTLIVDQWNNVRNATIVGNAIVPGSLIPPPV